MMMQPGFSINTWCRDGKEAWMVKMVPIGDNPNPMPRNTEQALGTVGMCFWACTTSPHKMETTLHAQHGGAWRLHPLNDSRTSHIKGASIETYLSWGTASSIAYHRGTEAGRPYPHPEFSPTDIGLCLLHIIISVYL